MRERDLSRFNILHSQLRRFCRNLGMACRHGAFASVRQQVVRNHGHLPASDTDSRDRLGTR